METENKLRLADVFVTINDPRQPGKVEHDLVELLVVAVNAVLAGAGLVLGQRATAEKSNEKTAIPELLATLALEGCIVTIDAMGTQANIAQDIRNRGADYILALKDNQPTLAASVREFFAQFQAAPTRTPHTVVETVEKDHARTGHAAHNLAVLRHITLNLIRLDPVKRKGGIKARRLIAATSDSYRAQLLGLA